MFITYHVPSTSYLFIHFKPYSSPMREALLSFLFLQTKILRLREIK